MSDSASSVLPHRVLLTGGAGRIGIILRQALRGVYSVLRITTYSQSLGEAEEGEELMHGDLSNLADVERMMEGVDVVIHMGAIAYGKSNGDDWDRILPVNIIGSYNIFEAARRKGVKRVVYGSTNHIVGFYRTTTTIDDKSPVRPDTRYGLSKVFGEGAGRLYADKYQISCVCLRIGSFKPEPLEPRMLATWISHRDMVQLVRRSVEAPNVHFEVVYGVSGNTRAFWDNRGAASIGYVPEDNAEDFAEVLLSKAEDVADPDDPTLLFQGGPVAAFDFQGDISKIN